MRNPAWVIISLVQPVLEGVVVAIGLAVVCMWLGSRAFLRENA